MTDNQEFIMRILYLLCGVLFILLGFLLFYMGIAGNINIVVSAPEGMEAKLVNSSPGALPILLGAYIIQAGRPAKIKSKTRKRMMTNNGSEKLGKNFEIDNVEISNETVDTQETEENIEYY